MKSIEFRIEKKLPRGRFGRAGVLTTPHGAIETPAFVAVGTKGSVKSLTPKQVKDLGAEVVLANTYHLYLQPGEKVLRKAGGSRDWIISYGCCTKDDESRKKCGSVGGRK